jgi:starch synthase
MEQGFESVIVKTDRNNELPTYFISNDRYFYRDHIYGYEDDGIRYYFFCRAVVEILKMIDYVPDILHCNDWHTGFLPLLIKKLYPGIKTVFTIHNITYQGFVPASYLGNLLTETELKELEWPNWLNFMRAGILYGDRITTVSPGYCEEILQENMSHGMSVLIKQRPDKVTGILNGIDTKVYDPFLDGVLAYPFQLDNIKDKKKNRTLLRKEYGLPDLDIPLIIMVSRLDYQKGIDLILPALHSLKPGTFQLLILGGGNVYYQGILSNASELFEDALRVDFEYCPVKAKRIYAAGDICLMPSQFEPCGLGHLYGMRYGAIPVVNPVGGLKDTVTDNLEHPENSTGFYMKEWSGIALAEAIKRAVQVYHTRDWSCYIKNAMNYDSSWSRSVILYRKLYKKTLMKSSDITDNGEIT